MNSNLSQTLTAAAREKREELAVVRREIANVTKGHADAAQHYQRHCDTPRVPGVPNPTMDRAHAAVADYDVRRQRLEGRARDLEGAVAELDQLVNGPANAAKSTGTLRDVRAAVAAAVVSRDKSMAKVAKLRGQKAAEHDAAEAGRHWQREQLLARIEAREPDPTLPRPTMPPEHHSQTADMIEAMVTAEIAAQADIDQKIVDLKADEQRAGAELLEHASYVRQAEYAEALAAFGPVWTRFKGAHIAAFGYAPPAPDLDELAEGAIEEAVQEARQVLNPDAGVGPLRRVARKIADALS